MPTKPALTALQTKAIGLLADGMPKAATGRNIGVDRTTLHRWCQNEEFSAALAAEVERRRSRTEAKLQEAADQRIDQDVATLKNELAEYHQALVNVQKQRLVRGRMMMEKAISRLKDLPEEALSAADATRMIEAGDRLLEKGLDNWGNAIAVDEVMQRLSDGQQ